MTAQTYDYRSLVLKCFSSVHEVRRADVGAKYIEVNGCVAATAYRALRVTTMARRRKKNGQGKGESANKKEAYAKRRGKRSNAPRVAKKFKTYF